MKTVLNTLKIRMSNSRNFSFAKSKASPLALSSEWLEGKAEALVARPENSLEYQR